MINNSCTPAVFFWWPDSLQLPSNPVSVCLPGIFWWKNPGGVTGSPWRSRISGSFCIGKQQTVESFNKFGIVLERKETHEPRETLGAEDIFLSCEILFLLCVFFYDQGKNVSSNMVKQQWSWLWLVTKQNMTCWYWSILKPWTCCLWVCEGARNIYKAQINIDSE